MSNIIEMKSICKSFGAVKALKNIDFAVRAGETMALVGENGAGKSTLMKVLTGVYTKDTGTILIGGEEVRKNNPVVAKNLGIAQVYQQFEMMDEGLFQARTCTVQNHDAADPGTAGSLPYPH